MGSKQKLAFLSAIILPLIALIAIGFLLTLSPPRLSASSCNGEYIPCTIKGQSSYGCSGGSGICYESGTEDFFHFCPPYQGGPPSGGGGYCNDGCVTCVY